MSLAWCNCSSAFGGPTDIDQHPPVLMVLTSAVPADGPRRRASTSSSRPIQSSRSSSTDLIYRASLFSAVDSYRAVGRLAATRARLFSDPAVVRAHCDLPVRTGDRRPSPRSNPERTRRPVARVSGLSVPPVDWDPSGPGKIACSPEDCVRQWLVIGGRSEQSAADHVTDIHGDVAWNP